MWRNKNVPERYNKVTNQKRRKEDVAGNLVRKESKPTMKEARISDLAPKCFFKSVITNLSENVFFMFNVLLLLCKQIIEFSQAWSRQTRGKKGDKGKGVENFCNLEKNKSWGTYGT